MKELEFLRNVWKNIPLVDHKKHTGFIKNHMQNVDEFLHTGESIYVLFNTYSEKIEDVSTTVEKLLGFTKDEFSMEQFFMNMHTDDLPYIVKYEKMAVEFFLKLNEENRLAYKFSYDYRFKTKNSNYKRIHHEVIPITFLKKGGAITLIIMTDISHYQIQGIPRLSFIGLNDLPSYYNAHLGEHSTVKTPYLLTTKELQILNMIVNGYKSKEIAEVLHRSIFTINNHRKEILKKMKCKNTNELITKSIREGFFQIETK